MNSARSHATSLVFSHTGGSFSKDFIESQEFANLLLYFGTVTAILFLVDIAARKMRR